VIRVVDRRLVAIIVIALAISTAAFSFMVGEKVDDPIEILKEEWNLPSPYEDTYRLPSEEGRYAYGLGLVVRKPIRQLEIVFLSLENESSMLGDLDLPADQDPWTAFLSVPDAGNLAAAVDSYATPTRARLVREELELKRAESAYDTYLIDLTGPFLGTAPRGTARSLRTVHALGRSAGGEYTQYFRGVRDFFLDRDRAIIDVSVQLNQNLTKYAQRTTTQGTAVPMDRAPEVGQLVFDHLEKEDQIFVSFAINPAMISTRKSIAHVVLIFIDGKYYRSMSSVLYRESAAQGV
jgi:hypothetical protein